MDATGNISTAGREKEAISFIGEMSVLREDKTSREDYIQQYR